MIGVQYGSTSLQSGGISVTDTDIYSAPENDVQADELAEADGAIIVKQRYKSKTFTVNGRLRTTTIEDTDRLVDTFKLAMSIKNQAFDIDYAGSVRRYLATAQNTIITRPKGLVSAGFSVQFLCPNGVGWDVDTTELLAPTTVTSSSASLPITVGGTYKSEPLITVTLTSITGGTAGTLTMSNNSSLRGMSITRNWISGDVLEIDSLNKSVFVNDVPTEFNGQWPTWDVGAGSIGYLDDFTTRSVIVEAVHTQRWL